MTLDQFGTILNLTGLLVPLAFSLVIARSYKRPFFLNWTFSLLLLAAAVCLFAVTGSMVPGLVLSTLLISLYQGGVWFFIRTAEAIRSQGHYPPAWRWAWGALLAVCLLLVFVGQPIFVALIGPILLLVVAHFLLARELWQMPHTAARWMSVFVALTGAWTLVFPALATSPLAWMGFVLSGTLHLIVGIQMVIYLLEDTALTLKAQNDQLQQLDRLKSEFISTVSHELRTPLSSIKSATWLLQNHRSATTEEELIGTIANQVDILQRLVSDVLDFAKMESGTLSYQFRSVELSALARAVMHDVKPGFIQKGIDLIGVPSGQRARVEADPDRLAQVIGNLLSNALKFTDSGGQVMVRVDSEDGWVRLAVQDNGVGVPADQRLRIFERFYQVDNSSTRQVGGAGLGLAISRAIIEEGHHGRIWVEDTPGGGSTFFIALPQAKETAPAESLEPRLVRE